MASTAELEQMAEHVWYEVDELRKAVQKLSELKKADSEWNTAIESFLLHFRNLRAFFFGKGHKTDDVYAKDYIVGWNATPDPIFDKTKDDIDKRLAHLTTWRLKTFSWPVKEMDDAIEELVSKFKKSLTAPQTGWFSGLAERTVVFVLGATSYSTCSTNSPSIVSFRLPKP